MIYIFTNVASSIYVNFPQIGSKMINISIKVFLYVLASDKNIIFDIISHFVRTYSDRLVLRVLLPLPLQFADNASLV